MLHRQCRNDLQQTIACYTLINTWVKRCGSVLLCLMYMWLSPTWAQPRFVVSVAGDEVVDTQQKLVFKRCPEPTKWENNACKGTAGEFTYSEAQQYIATVNAGKSTPWRLPSQKELFQLFKVGLDQTRIATDLFPAQVAGQFWTSSNLPSYPDSIWVVHFNSGQLADASKSTGIQRLRLIRKLDD